MDYEKFILELLDAEPAVFGSAVIDKEGTLLYQTENWDLQQELPEINNVIIEAKKADGKNPGRIEVMKIAYMIVEFTPERVIATNVARKGHIVITLGENGTLISFIDPTVTPRDALFNLQTFARKL
ncbi:MAG: hypothetical protein ACTSWL_05010 [Promethearchaeota archaeon]